MRGLWVSQDAKVSFDLTDEVCFGEAVAFFKEMWHILPACRGDSRCVKGEQSFDGQDTGYVNKLNH